MSKQLEIISCPNDEFIIKGALNSLNCTEFEKALRLDPMPETLILDLSGLQFISSAGIRELVRLHKNPSTKLIIKSPSAPVLEILEMTGLDEHLNIQ